jgi:polyhydroxyalkanoate synthesis repressor PhaR
MAVLIKRYANRKLYNTQSSRYITLKGIADLLESGEDVRVIDNESGEDITSITLSQILVDTERANRAVPGSLLSGLFQRGGDALYEALSRGVDDASERLEEFQRTMRRLLRVRDREEQGAHSGDGGLRGDADEPAVSELDRLVRRALERVLSALDLPRRADLEALQVRLDRLIDALGERVPPELRRPAPPEAEPDPRASSPSDPPVS